MIHKLRTLGILAILSLVSTMRLEEVMSPYGPVKTRTKRRLILLFPAGKGEARIFSLVISPYRPCS
jgi:hypothetical protein